MTQIKHTLINIYCNVLQYVVIRSPQWSTMQKETFDIGAESLSEQVEGIRSGLA